MLPRKPRHLLYALLLMVLSVLGASALPIPKLNKLFIDVSEGISSVVRPAYSHEKSETEIKIDASSHDNSTLSAATAPYFVTIINGANEQVTCSIDGSTLAKFFLCGTGDNRTLTLSQSGSSYTWQKLGAGCAFVGTDTCPVFNSACNGDWATVGTGATFALNASSSTVAGEYRVRVDSGSFFYFRVSSNPLNPQVATTNIICGNPGRVEVTNVPSGYEYSLNSAAGPYQDLPYFTITSPGSYQVFSRLKNAPASACIFPSEVVNITEIDMTVDVSMVDITCSGDFGSISVNIDNVPGFYSYRLIRNGTTINTFGPNSSNSHTFNNVGPGTYTIQVTAGSSCSETINTISGNPITIGAGLIPLEATAFATDSFGCGATSVNVTLNASGGTAPYQYSLNGGATFSSNFPGSTIFAVTTPGTYNLVIRDAQGCTKTAAVEVQDIPPPVFNVVAQDANCGGANNGSITVNVTNSNGYNLQYSNNNGTSFQNSNVFSNLAPGTYNVVIQYQQDTFVCTTSAVVRTISTPSSITGTATATQNPSCANETGGQITFSGISGGVGPYAYSIGSGFLPGTTVFNNLSTGTYTPQIRDANGCVETLPNIVFAPLNKPTDINFTVSSIDCVTGTASVSLAVTGGSSINSYQIIAPISVNNGGSNVFTGLGLGSYTFRVTDTNGCNYTESFAITSISSIRVASQLISNVTCVGDSDGQGRFIVDGFASTYRYQIDSGPVVTGQTANLINLNTLAAGSYVISVTDDQTNCTDTATLTIAEPSTPLALTPVVTDMNCQNNNRGAVNANASGGWGSYQYTLSRPSGSPIGPRSNPNFTGLTAAGNYTITVTDSEGCAVSSNFTLTPISAPSLTLDAASDLCFDSFNAATLTVLASGGAGPYLYRINGGPWGGSATFGSLNPATYTIEVRDSNDCRAAITRTIRPQTTTTASIQRELACGGIDAEIRVDIANGNTPYADYAVSFNGGAYGASVAIAGTSFVFSTAASGAYRFRVTDNLGCIVETNEVVISPLESIVATASVTAPRCGDPNTGIVTLVPDATVGIPPYQYSTDGSTYTNQAVYANLAPGNYTYYVRDSRLCFVAVPFTVGPPAPGVDATVVANDAVCAAGSANGSIDVTGISDGLPPYTYTLLDASGNTVGTVGPTPSTTATFSSLPQGSYTVITNDNAGCEDTDVVVISQNTIDVVPVAPTTPPDCTSVFPFIVDIVGGTGPFQIGLVGNPLVAPNVTPTRHDFTGQVVPGVTYFVEVVDDLGCRYIEEIGPVPGPNPLVVTAMATGASCDVSGNGVIGYTLGGFTGPNVSVTVTDTDTGAIVFGPVILPNTGAFPDITGLAPGNYQIIVQDSSTSCQASDLVSIVQDIPSVVIDSNTNANCNNPNGQLVVRGVGGTPGYTFAVVPNLSAAPGLGAYTATTIYDLIPGNYDIYLRDSQGCNSMLPNVAINMDAGVPNPTVNVVNQCIAVTNFNVFVTSPLSVVGSTLPEDNFQYDIGNGFQNSPNFLVTNPGMYTITVRDGNGCTNTILAEVFDFFSITASASAQPSCNNLDGSITITTSGGSGNFEYVLDDGTTTVTQTNNAIFTGLGPGNFTITVTDLSSNTSPLCEDVATVVISAVDQPIIDNLIVESISCFGNADGSIIVELDPTTATDGPFVYNLYDSANVLVVSQADAIFDGLTQGTYEVEVVSSRGCPSPRVGAIIGEPSALLINLSAPPFSCNTASNVFNTTTITVFADTNGDGTGSVTGTAPYSYSINDGTAIFDGTNFQSANTFEIIDAGSPQTILVTIRDANGCEVTDTVVLNPPTDLTFSFNTLTAITCDASGAGVTPGIVEIIINQGPGNYGVEILPLGSQPERFSGGSDRVVWDLDTPGDYIFAVRDLSSGGCLFVTPVYNVPEFNVIEAVIAEVKPVTCFGGNDGEISIEINNYTGVYNYEIFRRDALGVETSTGVTGTFDTANPINTPELITGLPAGNLVARIEALNTPFCDVASNVATVRSPDRELTVTPVQTDFVTCFVPGRGEITATGDGGWGGYTYQLEIETTPGNYTEVVAFGTANVFSNLSQGNYRVNIGDSAGCIRFNTITLDLPDPISADIQIVQPLLCPGSNDGIIEAFNVIGGEDLDGDGEEYLFQLNRLDSSGNILNTSGLQTSSVFPNLPAGLYSIVVYDGWNCAFTTNEILIQDPAPVDADLVETLAPGCGDEGRMELTITNPIPGMEYFYRRSGTSDPFVSFGGTDVITVEIIIPDVYANPGPYQFDVQNGNGCPEQQSNEINLDKALPLVVGLDLVDANIKCAGEATGIIRSEAFGGVGNYSYILVNNDLDSGVPGVPRIPNASDIVRGSQSSGIFRDLGPGNYWVFAQSLGCIAISDEVLISPVDPLILERLESVPVSCNGDTDGQIIIEVSGGTGIVRFSISETLSEFFEGDPANPNSIVFSDLPPGTYEIIAQDELGCTILEQVTVTQPDELVASTVNTTPETCINAADGTATLNVMGGTPFVDLISGVSYYETQIIGPNSVGDEVFERNDSLFIDNLVGGETYVVFIRDAMGCETNVIIPIEIGVDLAATPLVVYGCEGIFPNSTVTVQMQDSSLLPRLLFSLDADDIALATDQRTFGNLAPGDHTVYIYHENGCATFVTFTIDAFDPLTLTAEKTGPNEITAMAAGGFGGYEYYFQGVSTGSTNVFLSNEDALVTIRVVDLNGCEATVTIPFEFTGMLEIPNFFTPDGDNINDIWAPKNRDFFPNIEVKIYDRYGRVVAVLNDVAGWDGTYNGKELPTGDYWYVVNANDKSKQQFVGHFTLYR
ncbi:T9SS type B sorting domain-containing protein [Arenibacter sp. GZD96]|uniref:T9SS type B sorting domain-containing protein n=1 Tax=Aurantibrevibacter litoralis TaxID=3106030 RepID=UPI002AFE8AE3|nr:T9SS type B sorting domain-containing protein [Arenibacter sp. GZD-96]MEA1785050.1 T9SS type B sorting domain-containing protein [Arenibacter sp. GZD-96]